MNEKVLAQVWVLLGLLLAVTVVMAVSDLSGCTPVPAQPMPTIHAG